MNKDTIYNIRVLWFNNQGSKNEEIAHTYNHLAFGFVSSSFKIYPVAHFWFSYDKVCSGTQKVCKVRKGVTKVLGITVDLLFPVKRWTSWESNKYF